LRLCFAAERAAERALRRAAQELEAMKARLKEMEDEAAKLRQMQARGCACVCALQSLLRAVAPFADVTCAG